ncbi:hypothetical protein H0X06_06560 [Candidatus Dependentiae bacterium]|nr:hypothetical protein [Candidatus Dependentiae bacterium]
MVTYRLVLLSCNSVFFTLFFHIKACSLTVPSLKSIAAQYIVTTEHMYDYRSDLWNSDIEGILSFEYCLMHSKEAWMALASRKELVKTAEKIGFVRNLIILKNDTLLTLSDLGKMSLSTIDSESYEISPLYGRSLGAGRISSLVVSPNQKYCISTSSDGNACIWRVGDGSLVKTFFHPMAVTCAAFNDTWDLDMIVTGCIDGYVRLFNCKNDECIQTIKHCTNGPGDISYLAFLSDSQHICAGGASRIHVWDREKNQTLYDFKSSKMEVGSHVALSLDGHAVSIDACSDLKIVSFDKKNPIKEEPVFNQGVTTNLAVGRNLSLIVTAVRQAETAEKMSYKILLWSYDEKNTELTLMNSFFVKDAISALSVSKDNQTIFYSDKGRNIGVLSFQYLSSLLRLQEAKFVIALIKKVYKGGIITQEEWLFFQDLPFLVKNALTLFYEKCNSPEGGFLNKI